MDGGVDLEEVDFGLELNGGAGGLVQLVVLDSNHQQELSKVSLNNSRYYRYISGGSIGPYDID